jgi:hypothetical protein
LTYSYHLLLLVITKHEAFFFISGGAYWSLLI